MSWCVDRGEMGRLVRDRDWSSGPLGPLAAWPPSLCAVLRLAFASSLPMGITWGSLGTLLYNEAYARLLGDLHPAALGQPFSDAWKGAWPVFGDSFRRALEGASSVDEDRPLVLARRGASEEAFVTSSFSPILDDAARVGGVLHVAMETTAKVTGRQRAQSELTALAESDRAVGPRARVLLADGNADTGSYVARLLRRIYDVQPVADGNAALESALEAPPDVIVADVTLPGRDGLELLKALRATERTCLIPVILLSAQAGEDAALEGLDAGADDYLVKPFSGKALLARVRSSLALARMRKESADKLREANKELEAFSYSVSHDLRAPLRAIDGFSRALLSEYGENLDEQGRRYLDRVRAGSQRMAQLIDDLLGLSRITRAPLTRERADLTTLARRVFADLAARDPERKVETQVAEGLEAQADPRLVLVMLENLLGNAWKFTSKQPEARIEVGRESRDGETVFVIRDNGAGFEMEYASKLFAPFQRLHSAAEFQGTGIGLATVHRVVTRHGGRIWAEAAVGRGAAFFFTLGEASSP